MKAKPPLYHWPPGPPWHPAPRGTLPPWPPGTLVLVRLNIQPMNVTQDDAVGERTDQRDDADIDERAHERSGGAKGDADDEREIVGNPPGPTWPR